MLACPRALLSHSLEHDLDEVLCVNLRSARLVDSSVVRQHASALPQSKKVPHNIIHTQGQLKMCFGE